MGAELCRAMAYEAVRRGARANVHELWAALEAVDKTHPQLIVDIGSGRAVQWAWWALGARVIVVSWAAEQSSQAFSGGRLPESMTELVADPRERDTVLRVTDQVARRPVDVLVLGMVGSEDNARTLFHAYAPLVRPGGLVLLHGVADPLTPGVGRFWRGLDAHGRTRVVDQTDPIGIGIIQTDERART
jgi:hypothetical protein